MKYYPSDITIPLADRKGLNRQCLKALGENTISMMPEEIYNNYTGIGGLHGLHYVDFGNYHDFSEAKKEIEQGQFFTPDALCAWVMDCLRPDEREKIADLTCGKGSFFNYVPVESNAFGCEIEPDSFAIAKALFPRAHIRNGDVRNYSSRIAFDLVVGNPPYNIAWDYRGKKMSSQCACILKMAEVLTPGGLLAVIVPESFLGETTAKIEKEQIYKLFNHVVQISLDANTFSYLGVRNFSTKLLILQRCADALAEAPYTPEIISCPNSEEVYNTYIAPAKDIKRREYPKMRLQQNRAIANADEKNRLFDLLLYQIKCHPKTKKHYEDCMYYREKYRTQQCPSGMIHTEWERVRIRSSDVVKKMKTVLAQQNEVEIDKIELVKKDSRIYYKAYSQKVENEAHRRTSGIPHRGIINRLVTWGSENEMEQCGIYTKLIKKKKKAYLLQTTPFVDMRENSEIKEWLTKWELSRIDENFQNQKIKLNAMQLQDTNLTLQKPYAYLQWSQGAGKTISGIAQGMYRLAKKQVNYVFVISSAISIEGTWAPFLEAYGIPHKVIRSRKDLRRVYPGDFVLITLGRVKNYKKQIKFITKLASNKLFLIYDEAQNSSALEENESIARLTKATLTCFAGLKYKLLMSGTSISNNVVEAYPQLYLLYNASCNMLSQASKLYTYSEDTDSYHERFNEYLGDPYPPYMKGRNLFRASHLPEKLTVFGVVKRTPDIFNAEELRNIISYTMITRTFAEVTGKDLERRQEICAVMTPKEKELYEVAVKEFSRLEYQYFHSTNLSERKKAQARIIAQIKIMLRICTCAGIFPEYRGDGMTGKLKAIFAEIAKHPNERVAIGVRQNKIVSEYARMAREFFPERPVITVTGNEFNPQQRRALVDGKLSDLSNAILISTQQSLCESISIDYIDHCFLAELHWNQSRMAQYYFRFIRYTSDRIKNIYCVNYPDSIETNLLHLLVAKERMLQFLKGNDISFEELFAEMGFDLSKHQGYVEKQYDENGRAELAWCQQDRIAA